MIVKVQLSLASSDGVRRVLVYNESRTFRYEGAAEPDLVAKMAGRDKLYCRATPRADGVLDLHPDDETPGQDW